MNSTVATFNRFPLAGIMLLLLCLAAPQVAGQALGQIDRRFEWSHPAMGVQFQFVVYAANPSLAEQAQAKAAERIEQLEQIFSDYRPNSEINRLAVDPDLAQGVQVSEDLFRLLEISKHWNEKSHGAFDVTIGPLSKLWRAAFRARELPATDQIEQAKSQVGFGQLRLIADRRVAASQPSLQLDFGGIAKGDAADQVLKLFRELGIKSALVDASGDISTMGRLPNGEAWRIELPSQEGIPAITLRLADQSVATSGSLYQALEIDGRRYSHIIDPRTGVAVQHTRRATIIAPTGASADALASACSVLPPEESMRLIQSVSGAELFLIADQALTSGPNVGRDLVPEKLRAAKPFESWMSRGFVDYLDKQ